MARRYESRGHGRILVRPVEARARQQLGFASVQTGVHAISVVLDLVEPFRALGRRVYQFAACGLIHFGRADVVGELRLEPSKYHLLTPVALARKPLDEDVDQLNDY
jgi:hypothetical protein